MQNFRIPDSIFPTENDFEVPTLRRDMQAQTCEVPFVCYGEQRRAFRMEGNGTLHFYTDDCRFNTGYDRPERILVYRPRNIVEPNYTLTNETAVAFGLQMVYKKRALARSFQDKGIRVYVDLNVANKFYAYNLLGVPDGWSSFCTRGYADRLDALEFEYMIACRVAGGNPLNFVVYGGGNCAREWCKQKHCVYVAPVVRIKEKIKSMVKMAENVNTSLFADVPDFGPVVPSIEELMREQVQDNRGSIPK